MVLVFGDHRLDIKRRELRRGTELIDLEPKVFDLLAFLVQHRDRVVSKDELRSFLDAQLPEWPAQLDPVIAPAVRNAETLSAIDYLARVERLRTLAQSAEPRLAAVDVIASP